MSVTAVLRVRTPPSMWGAHLHLVGNLPELCEWGTYAPIPLNFVDGHFTAAIALPAHARVEYKYVLSQDGKVVRWEAPSTINRILNTGANGSTIVVDDGVFGTDQHTDVAFYDKPPSVDLDFDHEQEDEVEAPLNNTGFGTDTDDNAEQPLAVGTIALPSEPRPQKSSDGSTVDTHLDDDLSEEDTSTLKNYPPIVVIGPPPPQSRTPEEPSRALGDDDPDKLAEDLDECAAHMASIRRSMQQLRLQREATFASARPLSLAARPPTATTITTTTTQQTAGDLGADQACARTLAQCLAQGPALVARLRAELDGLRAERAERAAARESQRRSKRLCGGQGFWTMMVVTMVVLMLVVREMRRETYGDRLWFEPGKRQARWNESTSMWTVDGMDAREMRARKLREEAAAMAQEADNDVGSVDTDAGADAGADADGANDSHGEETRWQDAVGEFWQRVESEFGKPKSVVCERMGWPGICGARPDAEQEATVKAGPPAPACGSWRVVGWARLLVDARWEWAEGWSCDCCGLGRAG